MSTYGAQRRRSALLASRLLGLNINHTAFRGRARCSRQLLLEYEHAPEKGPCYGSMSFWVDIACDVNRSVYVLARLHNTTKDRVLVWWVKRLGFHQDFPAGDGRALPIWDAARGTLEQPLRRHVKRSTEFVYLCSALRTSAGGWLVLAVYEDKTYTDLHAKQLGPTRKPEMLQNAILNP